MILTQPNGKRENVPDKKMKKIINPAGGIVKVSPEWYDVFIKYPNYKKYVKPKKEVVK